MVGTCMRKWNILKMYDRTSKEWLKTNVKIRHKKYETSRWGLQQLTECRKGKDRKL